MVVLPALGGETTRARLPMPSGANRSSTRAVRLSGRSRRSRRSGWMAVRLSKRGRCAATSGRQPATSNARTTCGRPRPAVTTTRAKSPGRSPWLSKIEGGISASWPGTACRACDGRSAGRRMVRPSGSTSTYPARSSSGPFDAGETPSSLGLRSACSGGCLGLESRPDASPRPPRRRRRRHGLGAGCTMLSRQLCATLQRTARSSPSWGEQRT